MSRDSSLSSLSSTPSIETQRQTNAQPGYPQASTIALSIIITFEKLAGDKFQTGREFSISACAWVQRDDDAKCMLEWEVIYVHEDGGGWLTSKTLAFSDSDGNAAGSMCTRKRADEVVKEVMKLLEEWSTAKSFNAIGIEFKYMTIREEAEAIAETF